MREMVHLAVQQLRWSRHGGPATGSGPSKGVLTAMIPVPLVPWNQADGVRITRLWKV
jgi:hypothetical protein